MHGREHVKYNENLHAHGYPVPAMDQRVQRILRLVSRALPSGPSSPSRARSSTSPR